MQDSRLKHACAISLALLFTLAVSPSWAQWSWRDANGSIQYSDTPPPPSVPTDRILKKPGVSSATTPASPAPAASSSASGEGATPSWVEQNAEFMKRRQQRQEQEQKDKETKQAAADKKRQCAHARDNLEIYESATPILHRAADGERRYMTTNERAAEAAKIRQILKECR